MSILSQKYCKDQKGFSLVEILVALSILLVLIISFSQLFQNSYKGLMDAGKRIAGSYSDQEDLEKKIAANTKGSTGSINMAFDDSGHIVNATVKGETLKSGQLSIFLPKAPVDSITLDHSHITLTNDGSSRTINATISPPDAENIYVTWASNNPGVATVNPYGLSAEVEPKGVGTATISVTTADGGKIALCSAEVNSAHVAVTGVSLNQDSISLKSNNKNKNSYQLNATVVPANATYSKLLWSSNKPSIATVDQNGLVKATGKGDAIITVTVITDYGVTKQASCQVKVT